MADVKDQVLAAIAKNKAKYDVLEAAAEDLVKGVFADAQGVLRILPEAKDFAGVAIDVVDDMTSTGVFDPVDAPLAKMLIKRFIGEKTEAMYQKARAQALAAEI